MVITAATKDEMRLNYIIEHAELHPTRPEVRVPSTSNMGSTYVVYYNPATLITERCTCPATNDCLHRLGVDTILRERRPSLAQEEPILFSLVCGHRVKANIHLSCGCDA
jgi:hypothetical protein